MRPLLLTAALLAAVPWANAQKRFGPVEAAAGDAGSQAGSLTSALSAVGAPRLVTLNLAAPAFGTAPNLPPLALTPALTPAPYAAVPIAQRAMPAARPVSYISPAPPAVIRGANSPRPGAASGDVPQDLEKIAVGDLIDLTKRLFGESAGPGYQPAEYFRPGAPFEFGAAEAFRYRSALLAPGAKSGTDELKILVAAAEGLAKSAGIAVEAGERAGHDGILRPVLKILPARGGHRLNRLAWDLRGGFDSSIEYAPHRTNGGVAAYNSAEKVLFLPDFGRDDAFEAILHEARHAAFAKRLRRGDLSAFHASLLAYAGRSIAPNAMTYDSYMSMEELSTHAKTLLHAILRAQRGSGAAAADAKTYAYQLIDVLRSAEINLFQLQRMLDKGGVGSYRVAGPSWPLIAGGHWEAINLPHSIFVLPVLDGPPAPARGVWKRLFTDEPETAAASAARRHVGALRPLALALARELETFTAALGREKPDLRKARASAVRMTVLADRADKLFAAAP